VDQFCNIRDDRSTCAKRPSFPTPSSLAGVCLCRPSAWPWRSTFRELQINIGERSAIDSEGHCKALHGFPRWPLSTVFELVNGLLTQTSTSRQAVFR
jgi:hypothetical protein